MVSDEGRAEGAGAHDGTHEEAAVPRTITLPPMLPDQIEYLQRMQVALSDYDPETMIHGRKSPTDLTP